MKWNCKNCQREIISDKPGDFCLECWWKNLVEKTEINPETIRSFMEKHYFTALEFWRSDEYGDFVELEIHISNISSWVWNPNHYDCVMRKRTKGNYFPKTRRNIVRNRDKEENYNDEYSAFLEKLFHFAEKEKIKRIRADYSIKTEPNEGIKSQIVEKIIFKVSGLIIEKKTSAELVKEEEYQI